MGILLGVFQGSKNIKDIWGPTSFIFGKVEVKLWQNLQETGQNVGPLGHAPPEPMELLQRRMKLSLLGRRPGQPPRVNDDVPMAEKLVVNMFLFLFIGEKPWNFQQCYKT